MRAPTYTELRDHVSRLGHRFFTGAWNPNLMGIRNASRDAGQWDDLLLLAYEDDRGAGHVHAYQGTTDPGLPWLTGEGANPHPQGTAILVPQQARGCWAFGPNYLHRGSYPALCQVAPMQFVRDSNRDGILDVDALIQAGRVESGVRGFNGHRASAHRAVPNVGLYSAGCQVWRRPGDFLHVLDFLNWSSQWYGDRATYTLMDQWLGV